MEWVETTGKTVEEAVDRALDQLGIAGEDADVEILEEPRPGLFGRIRGTARVRARVRPTAPRPKQERRRRGGRKDREGDAPAVPTGPSNAKGGGTGGGGEGARGQQRDRQSSGRGGGEPSKAGRAGGGRREGQREQGDERGARAATGDGRGPSRAENKERDMMPEAEQRESGETFLRGLLEAMGLEGTVSSSLDESGILRFEVTGSELGLLIGRGLATLDATQEICRNAIQRQAAGREYGKVELDVAGARAARTQALEEFTRDEANRVLETGEEVIFDVMSRSDRKVVHDVISEFEGLQTESIGEDPRRRVVLRRA